ncbi:hypothetical protein [Neobacillus sp. YIM B06451]|uniref:hypothetical protein n=1 Tax=Neobacillus sp. YIM B06451 TaxID=3070994 RepID=UPI00293055B4|nr:hypothetical protein [Neobacillus sp. YIM B06451]
MYQPLDFAKIAKAIEATQQILNQDANSKVNTILQLQEADRNWKQALAANTAIR